MKDKKLTKILHNIQNFTFFKYIGDVNIYDMEKCEIANLKLAIKKANETYGEETKWVEDRAYLINEINKWCDAYRCPSLYIK